MSKRRLKRPLIMMAALIFIVRVPLSAAGADEASNNFKKFNFDGLLQAWLLNDTTVQQNSGSNAATNFRVRRAELHFAGDVADDIRWWVTTDPAKALNTSVSGLSVLGVDKLLLDAAIAYKITPELEFWVGEFEQLGTAEGLDSTAELLFPERSMVGRAYGYIFEPGAMLQYRTPLWRIAAAVSNGHGWNTDDSGSNAKALHLRGDLKPVDFFSVGAFTDAYDFSYGRKADWGANLRVSPIENLGLRAEGVRGYNPFPGNGYVLDAAYQIESWQPVIRFEMAQDASATGTAWTLGVNYFLQSNRAKIQFAYLGLNNVFGSFGENSNTGLGASSTGYYIPSNGYHGSLVILAFQAAI